MKVSVILPTFNEKENIEKLIPRIFSVFKKNNIDGNVIVVDDNSPDGTSDVVKRLQKEYRITLIERPKKMGIGSAYITGFKRALENGSDIVMEMDSDLSHDPEYIPEFLEKINQGFDLVIGSRRVKGGGTVGLNWYRKLVSFGGNFVGKHIAGVNAMEDLTSGYRAFKREVIEGLDSEEIDSESYAFQLEVLGKVKKRRFKVGSIPFVFYSRCSGKSKLSKRDIVNFFLVALKLRLGWI